MDAPSSRPACCPRSRSGEVICHCFGITRSALEAEWREKGSLPTIAEIAEKVRAGEARCAELHPQGICCLGELRQVARELQHLAAFPEPEPSDACGSCSDAGSCSSCG